MSLNYLKFPANRYLMCRNVLFELLWNMPTRWRPTQDEIIEKKNFFFVSKPRIFIRNFRTCKFQISLQIMPFRIFILLDYFRSTFKKTFSKLIFFRFKNVVFIAFSDKMCFFEKKPTVNFFIEGWTLLTLSRLRFKILIACWKIILWPRFCCRLKALVSLKHFSEFLFATIIFK